MKRLKFVRYGGLSPLKQKHYVVDGEEKGFHNPPRRKGLYCMIQGYEERFLLGATDSPRHISGKTQWLKDDNGDLIKYNDDWGYDEKTFKLKYPREIKQLLKKRGFKINQVKTESLVENIECPDEYEIKDSCDGCPVFERCQQSRITYLAILKRPRIIEYTGELWHHLIDSVPQHEILGCSGSWVKTTYDVFVKAFNKDKHKLLKNVHKKYIEDISEINEIGKDPYKNTPIRYSKDSLEVFIEKL